VLGIVELEHAIPYAELPLGLSNASDILIVEAQESRTGISSKKRQQILKLGSDVCEYCEVKIEQNASFQIDHRVPVSRGGSNHENNLCSACPDCNGGKNASAWFRAYDEKDTSILVKVRGWLEPEFWKKHLEIQGLHRYETDTIYPQQFKTDRRINPKYSNPYITSLIINENTL
jgi:5-methylcytosine-specific restriction endonuclease McrA